MIENSMFSVLEEVVSKYKDIYDKATFFNFIAHINLHFQYKKVEKCINKIDAFFKKAVNEDYKINFVLLWDFAIFVNHTNLDSIIKSEIVNYKNSAIINLSFGVDKIRKVDIKLIGNTNSHNIVISDMIYDQDKSFEVRTEFRDCITTDNLEDQEYISGLNGLIILGILCYLDKYIMTLL